MQKNNLETLRNHLFDTITSLKDDKEPMDIDRAKAIADVASVILESAKVEIGYMRVTGGAPESGFITAPENGKAALPAKTAASFECMECGRKFDTKNELADHKRHVQMTGRHDRKAVSA